MRLWFKHKRPLQRITWPTPETDYEGNDMWSQAFPKPKPLSPHEATLYDYMRKNQLTYWDFMCQQANRQIYHQCHQGVLGGLGGWL